MPMETRGPCAACGSHHRSDFPHDVHARHYRERFAAKYGREPTWADACAHCDPDMVARWKEGLAVLDRPWTDPPEGERPVIEHPDSFVGGPIGSGARRPMYIQDDQGPGVHYMGKPPERDMQRPRRIPRERPGPPR